jgi:hypothetical protein
VGVVLAQMTTDFGGFAVPSKAGFQTGLLIGAGLALLASVIALCIPQRASLAAEDHIEHPEHAEGAEGAESLSAGTAR